MKDANENTMQIRQNKTKVKLFIHFWVSAIKIDRVVKIYLSSITFVA